MHWGKILMYVNLIYSNPLLDTDAGSLESAEEY